MTEKQDLAGTVPGSKIDRIVRAVEIMYPLICSGFILLVLAYFSFSPEGPKLQEFIFIGFYVLATTIVLSCFLVNSRMKAYSARDFILEIIREKIILVSESKNTGNPQMASPETIEARKTLSCDEKSTREEIMEKSRKEIKKYHPDFSVSNKKERNEKTQQIIEARNILLKNNKGSSHPITPSRQDTKDLIRSKEDFALQIILCNKSILEKIWFKEAGLLGTLYARAIKMPLFEKIMQH